MFALALKICQLFLRTLDVKVKIGVIVQCYPWYNLAPYTFHNVARVVSSRFKDVRTKISYSIDFLHFFAKRRKSVEEMTHRKKIGLTERPRSLNPGIVIAMAICLTVDHFIT